MADRARFDQNLIPSLIAVSNADGITPVSVWADPSTHGLISSATLGGSTVPATGLTSAAAVQIVDGSGNQITSFGGGTQYTNGGTPPTNPIGPTLEFNNAGTWTTVGSANPLPVTGAGGGTVTQGTAAALTAGWPTINGEATDVTGTFTNATQTTSVTASNLDGYGNTLISINGTYGTATAIFEGSDDSGTTWYTVQAARDNSNVIETGYTSLTNTSQTWQINNPGFDSLRVRSTAVASGTVNVRLSSSAAPVASGTIVGIGTSIPAGTNVIGSVELTDGTNQLIIPAIGSTTSGQTGILGMAAVTTGSPSYTTGQTSPLSMSTSGGLRATLGTGTANIGNVGSISATGSAIPANAFYIAGQSSGNLIGVAVNNALGDSLVNSVQALATAAYGVNYNGSSWDRSRSATAASNTTGTGLLGSGVLGFDGTNWQRVSTSTAGVQYVLQRADTSTLSNVASSATSVVILATNTARKGASVYNDSTQILYLKFGTTASTTSFTVPLAAAAFFEVPSGYTGEMDGIWTSANGFARVTEIT